MTSGRSVARLEAELSYPPPAALDTDLTPVEHFFVRDHLSILPDLTAEAWRLEVGGLVGRPLHLTWKDLSSLATRELPVTLECAGNGNLRRGMTTAVGTAVFTGVALAEVLGLAGLDPRADEIVALGADSGTDPDQPGGPGRYARSLPLAKALDSDTLLATTMNGAPLTREHGYPARLVVPGHYGMDSVKWLAELRAVPGPFTGFYQAHRYREVKGLDGLHTGRYIRGVRVKSLITNPSEGERLPAGAVEVRGVAWAGLRRVDEVVVSADGGATWRSAELSLPRGPYSWRRWRLLWTPTPGSHELTARATDQDGETQPLHPLPSRTYEANWVHRVGVEVTR